MDANHGRHSLGGRGFWMGQIQFQMLSVGIGVFDPIVECDLRGGESIPGDRDAAYDDQARRDFELVQNAAVTVLAHGGLVAN